MRFLWIFIPTPYTTAIKEFGLLDLLRQFDIDKMTEKRISPNYFEKLKEWAKLAKPGDTMPYDGGWIVAAPRFNVNETIKPTAAGTAESTIIQLNRTK